MDTKTLNKKIELIQWLSTVEDGALIEKLLDFRKAEAKDWWEDLPEDEKASVNRGIADADSQKLKPHSDAKALYEKWL